MKMPSYLPLNRLKMLGRVDNCPTEDRLSAHASTRRPSDIQESWLGDIMKRAFLFGLGSFLIVAVLGALFNASFIIALILMPVSVIVIRAAQKAPPNISRSRAIIGWLIGFLVIDAVILGIYLLVS
jgi:hypothetical protein